MTFSLTLIAGFFTDLGIWLINQSSQLYLVFIANGLFFVTSFFSNSSVLIGVGTGGSRCRSKFWGKYKRAGGVANWFYSSCLDML